MCVCVCERAWARNVVELRAATGSELFSLTCFHTTTFMLLSIVSLAETIGLEI